MTNTESRAQCLSRLAEDRVQKKLADVFAFYFDDLEEILFLASSQNDGERPENLSNEVFSCFHHLARGLCASRSIKATLEECDKAIDSHLKRATIDSYKIAIRSFLQADRKLKEVLDYLVLVEDFEKYVPDGIAKINAINNAADEARTQLRLAKRNEAYGKFDDALECFNESLDKAIDLKEGIKDFTHNQTYQLACAREARERKDRKKDRSNAILAAVMSAVLTAILTLGISWWLSDTTNHPARQVDSPPEESSASSPATLPESVIGK